MSEATLKKKTRTQYRNMSAGSKNNGFSLNGTRRSQGYVGQTMLGRHFPRTPMRGNEARGSGGCCGKYYRGSIIQSGVPFPSGANGNSANNDPRVVKPSVMNNSGLILTKYRWIRRPHPYSAVKDSVLNTKDDTITSKANTVSQGLYIANKSANLVKKLSSCNQISFCKKSCGNARPFGSVIHYPRSWVSITKTAETKKLGPISQIEFIEKLTGNCLSEDDKKTNIVNINRGVLPGPAATYR